MDRPSQWCASDEDGVWCAHAQMRPGGEPTAVQGAACTRRWATRACPPDDRRTRSDQDSTRVTSASGWPRPSAPSSRHTSRSFASGVPSTVTGSCSRFHFRPVAIVSTAGTPGPPPDTSDDPIGGRSSPVFRTWGFDGLTGLVSGQGGRVGSTPRMVRRCWCRADGRGM